MGTFPPSLRSSHLTTESGSNTAIRTKVNEPEVKAQFILCILFRRYHMECLTPPLDAVPVEEWFCPECQASNRHSGNAGSYQQSLPSNFLKVTYSYFCHDLSPLKIKKHRLVQMLKVKSPCHTPVFYSPVLSHFSDTMQVQQVQPY